MSPLSTSIKIATAVIGFDDEAKPKMCVGAHRRALGDVGIAIRFEVHDSTAPRDERHDARDLAGVDVFLHRWPDAREPFGREPDILGFRRSATNRRAWRRARSR